jgi:acyl-CoA dehydrogenase
MSTIELASNAAQSGVEDDMSAVLLDQATRFFESVSTRALLSAADHGEWQAGLWSKIEDAGYVLALADEQKGGIGLPPPSALALVRLSAYHTLPVPLAEAMLATRLWTDAGGEVPSGVVTLAPNPVTLDKGRLSGTAKGVPFARDADHVLVLAKDSSGASHLALAPKAAFKIATRRQNLAYEPRDSISFDGAALSAGLIKPAPALISAEGLSVHGALIRCQQMVGAMERALDHALQYANDRVQFGRPIGKFQAVQHMLAVAAGHVAAASAATDAAGEAYDTARMQLLVGFAKSRVGDAAGHVAAITHQVHAAIGFTQEHLLHFATRRLWSWRNEFGNETYWQEQIGRLVCASGGAALWDILVGPRDG